MGEANDRSWNECYDFLQKYLPTDAELDDYTLAFEYMMPDSQKRADVLLLSRDKVIILEFKEKGAILYQKHHLCFRRPGLWKDPGGPKDRLRPCP